MSKTNNDNVTDIITRAMHDTDVIGITIREIEVQPDTTCGVLGGGRKEVVITHTHGQTINPVPGEDYSWMLCALASDVDWIMSDYTDTHGEEDDIDCVIRTYDFLPRAS